MRAGAPRVAPDRRAVRAPLYSGRSGAMMDVTVTEETRRRAQRLIEQVSRGFIDDSSIAFPDDDELAALKREAREAAERRRAGARARRRNGRGRARRSQ